MEYGGSQVTGEIIPMDASLHHSHSNSGFEPCLQHHSSWHCWILNPHSEARDQACVLMDSSQIRFCWVMMGIPHYFNHFEESSWMLSLVLRSVIISSLLFLILIRVFSQRFVNFVALWKYLWFIYFPSCFSVLYLHSNLHYYLPSASLEFFQVL